MRAEEIKIDTDEDGFYLVLRTDAGHLRVNVQDCATQLLRECEQVIGPWAAEAASVQRIFECGAAEIDESAGMAERVVAIREDGSYRTEPDEEPYDFNDPKHPRYHSVHVDLWDNREKV